MQSLNWIDANTDMIEYTAEMKCASQEVAARPVAGAADYRIIDPDEPRDANRSTRPFRSLEAPRAAA
jgi:hypothetical protein